VLVVAFVIVDQVARNYAQNKIAAKIVSSGFPVRPAVSIKGWPFLTQVLTRDIGRIDFSASNVRESTLDIASIKATATDVHIDSGYNSATVGTIAGTGLITFSALTAATGASGLTISADPSAGPNTARISVGPLYGTASVTRTGTSSITVKADSVGRIPVSALGRLGDYTIDIPHLMAGLEVSGVSVQQQGVVIAVSAHNTTLSGSGIGTSG